MSAFSLAAASCSATTWLSRSKRILADDSVLFREGLARVLEEDGFDVVGQVATSEELFEVAATASADVAIVDIRMPPTHTLEGLEAAVTIRSRWPALAVLVLSGYTSRPNTSCA